MKTLNPAELTELVNLLVGPLDSRAADKLLLLDDEGDAAAIEPHRVRSTFAANGHVVLILRLDAKGAVSRLLQFLSLPMRIGRNTRALRAAGVGSFERFAVSPDVRQPVVIHSLRAAAAAYARRNFLPSARGLAGIARGWLSRWAGCDPSVGAILIVGRSP